MNKSYITHRHTEYNGANLNKTKYHQTLKDEWISQTQCSEWKKQHTKGHTLNNESDRSQNSSY